MIASISGLSRFRQSCIGKRLTAFLKWKYLTVGEYIRGLTNDKN